MHSNTAVLTFLFPLQPCEYTVATDTTAFHFADCKLRLGVQVLNTHMAPVADIITAISVQLLFTTQKNVFVAK
jgi:hypothetical protein